MRPRTEPWKMGLAAAVLTISLCASAAENRGPPPPPPFYANEAVYTLQLAGPSDRASALGRRGSVSKWAAAVDGYPLRAACAGGERVQRALAAKELRPRICG